MRFYIIKIEQQDSNSLIWRPVIVPLRFTYKRLHDVIQNITNFQSEYPHSWYHLYEFDLAEKNRIVTKNGEVYHGHLHYKNKKTMLTGRLKPM